VTRGIGNRSEQDIFHSCRTGVLNLHGYQRTAAFVMCDVLRIYY
jgi:hypothetical protein